MVFKKIIFQNRQVALETPPFMAKAILNFHFDYLNPSLSSIYLQYFVHFSRQWHILRPSIQSVFQASRRSLIKFYLADATLSGPLSIPPA